MYMKRFLYTLLFAGFVTVLAADTNAMRTERPVVVELFTSQGCSSCPPADELLERLSYDSDVITMSYHVDYWNYIGWADPYSHSGFTKRQTNYNINLKKNNNYTPQMIIDGRFETVGSDVRQVYAHINEANRNLIDLAVDMRVNGKNISVAVPAGNVASEADIILVGMISKDSTEIKAGENRGRDLKSNNIVMYYEKIGSWAGEAVEVEVTPDWDHQIDVAAVIVQEKGQGRILGASMRPVL